MEFWGIKSGTGLCVRVMGGCGRHGYARNDSVFFRGWWIVVIARYISLELRNAEAMQILTEHRLDTTEAINSHRNTPSSHPPASSLLLERFLPAASGSAAPAVWL